MLDSVIGAYVTQAVSDVQSSTAFLNLAATWPAKTAAAEGTHTGGSGSGVAPYYQRGPVGELLMAWGGG